MGASDCPALCMQACTDYVLFPVVYAVESINATRRPSDAKVTAEAGGQVHSC